MFFCKYTSTVMDKRKRRLSSKMKDLEEEEESDESAESLILKQKCQKLLKIRVDGPGRKNIFADVEENPRKIRRSIVKRALRNVISSTPMPAKANEHFFSTECSLNISPIPPENSDNSPKKDTKKTNEDKKLDVITVSSDSEDVATSPKKGKEEQAPKMHTRSQSRKLGEKRSPNQMKNTEQSDLNAIKREEEVILNTNESHIDRHEITKSFVNHTESNSIEKSTKVARNAFKSPRSAKNISKSLHSTKNHSKASDSSKLKSTEKHKVGGNISNLTESRKRSALRSNLSKSLHHVKSYVESSCRSQSESDEESHEIGKKIMKSPRDIPNKSYSKCLSPIKEFQNCYRTRTEEWVKQIEDNSKNNVTLRKNGSQVVQSLVRERPEVRDEASEKVSRIPVFRTRSKSREKVDKSEPESSKENKPNENKIVSSPPKPAPRMKKKAKAGLTELSANINSMGVQVEDDEVPQKPAPEIGNSPKTKNTDKCLVDVGTSPNLLENPTSPAKNRLDSKSESKQVPELVLSPRAKRSLILNTFENRSISIDSKKVMRKNTSCSSFNTNSTSSDDKETKRKRLDLLLSSIVEKQKKSQSSPIVEGSKEHSNSILEGNSRTQHTQFQIPGVVIQKASSTIKSCARNIFTKTITEREGKTTAKNNVQNKKLVDIDHEDSLSSTNSSKMLEKYYDHSIHPKHSSKGALFNSLEEGPPVLEWHSRTESFNITEHVNDRVPWRFEQQLPRRSSYLPRLNFLRSAEEIECDKQSLSRKRLENEFDTSISITDESARDIDYIDETQNKEIKKKKRLKSTFRDYTHKSIRNMAETHRDTEEDISESCSSIFAESHNNIEQTSDHSKGSVESHLEQANDEKKAESEENTLTEDLDLHIEKQSNEYILATAQTSNKVHKASKNNSKLKKYTTKSFENEDNENVSTNSEEETDNEVISNVEKKQIDEDILANEKNENASTNSEEEMDNSNVEKQQIDGAILVTPRTRIEVHKNNSKFNKYKEKFVAENEEDKHLSTNADNEEEDNEEQINEQFSETKSISFQKLKLKKKIVEKKMETKADNEEKDNEVTSNVEKKQIVGEISGTVQTRNRVHRASKNNSKSKKCKEKSVAGNENDDNEKKDNEVSSNIEKKQINEEIAGTPQTRNKTHKASKNDSKFKKYKEKSVAENEEDKDVSTKEKKENGVISKAEEATNISKLQKTVEIQSYQKEFEKQNSENTNRGEPSHRSNASMKQKHLYNEVENVINESPNSSHRSCLQVEVENVLEISNCKTHESPIEKSGSYHLTNISQGSNLEMELENVPKMNEKEPVPLLTVDTVKSPKKSLRKSRPEEVLDKSLKRRKIIKKPVNSSSDDDFEKNGVVEPTCSETQSKLTTPAKKTKTDLTNKKDTFKVPKQKNGTVSSVISEIEDASDDTSLGGIRRSTRQRKPPTRRYLLGIPGRIDACSFTKRSSSGKRVQKEHRAVILKRTEMSTLKRSKRGAKQNEGGTVVTVAQIHTNTAVNDEHKTDSASSSDNLVHYGRDQMSQDLDEDNFLRVPDTHTVNQYSLTGSMRTINSFDVSGLRTTQVSSKVKKSNRKKKDITDIISVVSEDVAGKEKNETEMAHHERSITRNLLAGESEYEIVKQKYLGNNYQFQICQDDFSISNFIRINNGATMGYLQLPAKGMKPLHLTKKHTLCYIVMEGEGRIQIDNDILRVGKTDNFTIPLGSEYAIMNDSSDAMILACIKLAS
ncbi:hypothetical protein JTB14_031066 [Gonioctena quinquepunctata]|nr:hypothetical protein JTB14_031066 [Gonioctena quinquepunctata]